MPEPTRNSLLAIFGKGGPTFTGVNANRAGYGVSIRTTSCRASDSHYSMTPSTVIAGLRNVLRIVGTRLGEVIQTGFTRSTQLVPPNDGGVTFAATLADPFRRVLQPKGAADGPTTNVGNASTSSIEPRAPRCTSGRSHPTGNFCRFVVELGYQERATATWNMTDRSALSRTIPQHSPTRDQAPSIS